MAKSASLPNGNTDPSPSSSTSVFNALGSYADRIREKELKEGSVAKKDKSPNTAATDLPNGTSSHAKPSASSSGSIGKGKASMVSAPPPASTSSGKAKGKTESQSQNGKAEEKEKSAEEEGAWETVPAGRTRRKERDSTVSTNWRERPKERKEAGWRDEDKSKNGERGKKGTMAAGSTGNAPPSSSTTAALPRATNVSSNTQATPSSSTRSASVTPASSTRNPWGIVAPSPASGSSSLAKPRTGTSTPPTSSTTTAQTPKSAPRPATTPSSPSINAIGTTTSISATTSTASPNLSSTADTASTATVVTPRNGEDGDWRIRPRKLSTEMVDQDTTLVDEKSEKVEEVKEIKKTAAPPVVNAWAERRKAMGQPSTATIGSAKAGFSQSTAPATSSSPILFGSAEIDNPRPLVNGDAGPSGDVGTNTNIPSISSASKKKKTPQMSGQTRHVVDPNAFPDLASAQQVSIAKKGEKERSKEKESEESSVVDESGVAARKTKWTAIPAAELLAAADEAAETQRRIAREQAARRAKPPMPLAPDHLQSPVKQTRKKSVEARRGRTMRAGSGSELRLPPNPFPRPIPNGDASTGSTTVSATAQEFKPVFGNFTAGAGTGAKEQAAVGLEGKTGHSEPMSRQTSGSAISSPQQRSQTQLPSPTKLAQIPDIQIPLDMAALKMGMPGGPKSATEMGSNTTPIPQTGFPTGPGGPAIRGRGQRQSFSGRGRGGFRGGAGVGGGFKASNSAGDVAYLNNYGPGRGGGYGMTQNGYDQGYGVWDPMQGYGIYPITQMGGRTAQGPGQAGQQGQGQTQGQVQGQVQGLPMPPPPMPVTMAVGLDALRFYVLGQVEYYFSMQNLAMDFFLRQQMDSEGWIDISMITSFNRIKSLTPDPAIIKEVMLLSSLLEVREDKVRLSHGESKRWVLPDAKPSPFTDDSTDENHSVAGGSGDNGDEVTSGAAGGMDMGLVGWGSIPMTNGSTDNGGREGLAQDVKDALMKRGPSAPASTTTGTGTSTETGTEMGTGSGTRTNTENGDMEDDEGKIRGEMEETPGTSLSGEEAEKVELR